MNFFIFHGVYANPDANWFPWLKKKLEEKGFEAIVPRFPTPFDQSLESWLRTIKKFENRVGDETILIGHSLGAAFILSYLETCKKIKAAVLVAGFHKQVGSPYDKINETFVDKKFDWRKINLNCKNFFVVSSDNDEYISLKTTHDLSKKLKTKPVIIKNGGHLSKKSGFDSFPQLLELIEKEIIYKN